MLILGLLEVKVCNLIMQELMFNLVLLHCFYHVYWVITSTRNRKVPGLTHINTSSADEL